MEKNLMTQVATICNLDFKAVFNIISLLFEKDYSIAFIARYRKEKIASLNEEDIRNIRETYLYLKDLDNIRKRYFKVIDEHYKEQKISSEKYALLKKEFANAKNKQKLEDLYLPFKAKRKTRADNARSLGFDNTLELILKNKDENISVEKITETFLQTDKKYLNTNIETALQGAADILAEKINEDTNCREEARNFCKNTGFLLAKDIHKETHEKALLAKYQNYLSHREKLDTVPAHRIMLLRRAESEALIRILVDVQEQEAVSLVFDTFIKTKGYTSATKKWITTVCNDSFKRLMFPSLETEIKLQLKKYAENEAIRVFSKNLEKLLLLPATPNTVVCGIDPGFKNGLKIAIVDETGKVITTTTLFPNLNNPKSSSSTQALSYIVSIINQYKISHLAIGNGTGGRETMGWISSSQEESLRKTKKIMVNESGSSVYSVDSIAREELPNLDPTLRSAVSIARRLQDPLAELVKIDPKAIGVGQYQHDCNPRKLSSSLLDIIESCVSKVGVNINTASYKLLEKVAGIGPKLAKDIVAYREKNGAFKEKSQLKTISGLGSKSFEQCAGFLRLPHAQNPLDNSAIHPDHYEIIETIVKDLKIKITDLIGNNETISLINWNKYVKEEEFIGLPTLNDIEKELKQPGRDPRNHKQTSTINPSIYSLKDLKVGMKLIGVVSNVTNFGAFVDIGIHQDGLVHISELTDKFIKDPNEVTSVGKQVNVRVIDIDLNRKRISFSCRTEYKPIEPQKTNLPQTQHNNQPLTKNNIPTHRPSTAAAHNYNNREANKTRTDHPRARRVNTAKNYQMDKKFSAGDLLDKFNFNK
jgi:protein Tex